MTRLWRRIRELATVSGMCLGIVAAAWAQEGQDAIGLIAAIQRTATVVRAGSLTALPLSNRQPLLASDTLVTGKRARVQALFQDDTMLTLGQETRMAISEYLHDPRQQVRRMSVTLTRGMMRALVGRAFSGLGSTFVIHVGTASVIASSAYCVVWHTEQETGVVNIGKGGSVSFVSEGRVVILGPGLYSIARAGTPPSAAEPMNDKAPVIVREVIGETEVVDDPGATVEELAEQTIEEELHACPPDSPPGGICPRKPPPAALSPATPPAVTSGAVKR